jgi:integrase
MYALKSSEARRQYPKRLKKLFDFLNLAGSLEDQANEFLNKARQNIQWSQDSIMRFLDFHKERVRRKELAAGTLKNYYRAAKLFCEMNDLTLNWKRISKGLPRVKNSSNDRAPTLEEIRKLIEYPDRRIKPIVCAMASGGFRVGAWDYLCWKHVSPMTNEKGEVIAAKLLVYADEPEEYYTFITPEAYNTLKDWMDFRASYGEKITGESWVMRDLWQTTNINYGAKWGLATNPKKLQSIAIKRLLDRALWEQGIRHTLQAGVKRHEWKECHGYRKFYMSRAEQVMRPINVQVTMGHDLGVSESYWRPTVREVLEDYLKAVPLLTINGDNIVLQKQVAELTEKSRHNDYLIKEKLLEKDSQIEAMKEKYDTDIALLKDAMSDMQQLLKNPVKLAEIAKASI